GLREAGYRSMQNFPDYGSLMTASEQTADIAATCMPRIEGPVLYLTHRVPYPPDKGDRIRNFHLLRQLARRGRVWLGCLADEPVAPGAVAELERVCERVAVVPLGRRVRWVRVGLSLLAGRSLSAGAFA